MGRCMIGWGGRVSKAAGCFKKKLSRSVQCMLQLWLLAAQSASPSPLMLMASSPLHLMLHPCREQQMQWSISSHRRGCRHMHGNALLCAACSKIVPLLSSSCLDQLAITAN